MHARHCIAAPAQASGRARPALACCATPALTPAPVFAGYELTAADEQALQDRQTEGTADFKHILKIDPRYICVLGIFAEQIHPRGQPGS